MRVGSLHPETGHRPRLSLRSTLILWNVGASLLFVLICWAVFTLVSLGFGRSEFLNPGFIERATDCVTGSTPDTVSTELAKLHLPKGSSIGLFHRNSASKLVYGETLPTDPEGLRLAWQGKSNHRMVRFHSFTLWHPVMSGDQVSAVVGFSFPKDLAPPTLVRHLLLFLQAVVPATFVCLALMFGVNRRLTKPLYNLVRATERLGETELDYRVTVAGPSEFTNLGQAFNKMAAKLETTLSELTQEKLRVESIERSRREFLADMSHNLGTPLTAIQGWVGSLANPLAPSEQSVILAKIQRQVAFLSRTSTRLLELSRWEHTSPELFWEDFPVAEPLFEAVESIEDEALERQMELRFEGVEHYQVRADRSRVRELFQICLENAVKYAGVGTIVEVSMMAQAGLLCITVSDNGCGISAEELPKLTERFRCGSNGGNGLGLAIAAQLTQALGGDFKVISALHAGTAVHFQLKLSALESRVGRN